MKEKEDWEREVEGLEARVAALETRLAQQEQRLAALEGGRQQERGIIPSPETFPEPVGESPFSGPRGEGEKTSRSVWRLPQGDWEQLIGGTWFNRLGVVAVLLGLAFFLKLAIDNHWIGETGRVLIGIILGLGLLGGGEHFQKKGFPFFAVGLTGGGIAALYFSIYAAFAYYQLLGQLPAFAVMILITVTAVLLALRYDSRAIVVIGILGGFLTPFLLSTGEANLMGLFSYIAILNLGILAIAYHKRWTFINLLSFGLTWAVILLWMISEYRDSQLWAMEGYLTFFFLVYAFVAFLYNIVHRQATRPQDLFLILANAALYFATSYMLLEPQYEAYLGFFAVIMSLVYLGLGYLTLQRNRQDRYLVLTFLGVSLTFLTLAIPIQLQAHWITLAWALEGAVLTWVGFRTDSHKTRQGALLIFLLVVLRLMFLDAFALGDIKEFVPLFNRRVFTFLSALVLILGTAYLYQRHREQWEKGEDRVFQLLLLGSCFIPWGLISLEIRSYFDQQRVLIWENWKGWEKGWGYDPALDQRLWALDSAQQFALSIAWAAYGFLLLAWGFVKKASALRWLAMALLGVTVVKVFFQDMAYLERLYRILSSVGLGLILLLASYLYQRYRSRLHNPEGEAGKEEGNRGL